MKSRIGHGIVAGAFAGAWMIGGAAQAWGATLAVGPCVKGNFPTIQAAIDAAAPNDVVTVCAGTYVEQVTIGAGKDGVVLRSIDPRAAVIQAPATMADPGDIVRINAVHDVTLEGFTIQGPLPDALFCSTLPRTGVRVDGGASATVRGNRLTDIWSADPSLRGCQNGVPILVGSQPEGEVGHAQIVGNEIGSYGKTGILVDNAGSDAIVLGNEITGDGPSDVVAQNGIQVSFGADAIVSGNTVSGQIYSPTPLASALLLYLPGHVVVSGNDVRDADFGIATVDATRPEILGNTVSACTSAGIDLDQESTGTAGALVADNTSHDNGLDGIYVSASSTKSDVRENRMFGNREDDARDDSKGHGTAGTASWWHRNRCKTDNKGGLLCDWGE